MDNKTFALKWAELPRSKRVEVILVIIIAGLLTAHAVMFAWYERQTVQMKNERADERADAARQVQEANQRTDDCNHSKEAFVDKITDDYIRARHELEQIKEQQKAKQ